MTAVRTTTATTASRRLAAVALLAVLQQVPRASLAAAPKYDEASWNRAYAYETTVPNQVWTVNRLPPKESSGPVPREAAFYSKPLFPLDGFDVKRNCREGRPELDEANKQPLKPGQCWYDFDKASQSWRYGEVAPGAPSRTANCYCYALDKPTTGDFCMPGKGGGLGGMEMGRQSQLTCDWLTKAVVADGAVKVPRSEAMASNPSPKQGGHFMAMWLRDGDDCLKSNGKVPRCMPDFHFARRDASGRWSHKAGEAPVTDKDLAGKPMVDPEKADLSAMAYGHFCGYFRVEPSKMKVGGMGVGGVDRVQVGLKQWRAAGLKVEVTPLEYDAKAHAPDMAAMQRQAMMQQRQAQAAQRGGSRRMLA
jgi:hypothetical protein